MFGPGVSNIDDCFRIRDMALECHTVLQNLLFNLYCLDLAGIVYGPRGQPMC